MEEGGSSITRRTSSEFLARQAIFEGCQEGKYPDLSSFKFQTYTPYFQNKNAKNGRNFNNIESDSFKDYISHTEVWGQTPLVETRANGKRGRDEDESYSCGTKKMKPNTSLTGDYGRG